LANIKVIQDLLYYSNNLKNKCSLLQVFFMPPEWILKQLNQGAGCLSKRDIKLKNTQSPLLYMLFNTTFAICLYACLSISFNRYSLVSWMLIALIVLTLAVLGQVANGQINLPKHELIRSILLLLILKLLLTPLLAAILLALTFFIINYALVHHLSLIVVAPENKKFY